MRRRVLRIIRLNSKHPALEDLQVPWNCSVRDNTYFTETLLQRAATPPK